jgi:hypothetical protein
VAVDPATGAVSIGEMSCGCYCDHRAGCNMVADLVNTTRAILIQYSAGDSGYSKNRIWWSTSDKDFGDRDVCGSRKIPAWLQLAHELVHARLESSLNNETNAIRGENQVRLEWCIAMRAEYKNVTVPDFRDGILDNGNRPEYGCDCGFFRGGIVQTIRRIVCALHSMYCFPKPFSKPSKSRCTGDAK